MSIREKATHIIAELRGHVPFTLFGALLGIFFMLVFVCRFSSCPRGLERDGDSIDV
ncbi:MAG: hypothetical protein ACYS9T_05110 [Planctomycetota bacterium]|jgi:hypothetical protein